MEPELSLESEILLATFQNGGIDDSEEFCQRFEPHFEHKAVVGVLRSLEASEMVCLQASPRRVTGIHSSHSLVDIAVRYLLCI